MYGHALNRAFRCFLGVQSIINILFLIFLRRMSLQKQKMRKNGWIGIHYQNRSRTTHSLNAYKYAMRITSIEMRVSFSKKQSVLLV